MTPQTYCLILTFLVCAFAAWSNWSSQKAWQSRISAVQEHSAKHWSKLEVENDNLRKMVDNLHRSLVMASKTQHVQAPQIVNGTPPRRQPPPVREAPFARQVVGTDENLEG